MPGELQTENPCRPICTAQGGASEAIYQLIAEQGRDHRLCSALIVATRQLHTLHHQLLLGMKGRLQADDLKWDEYLYTGSSLHLGMEQLQRHTAGLCCALYGGCRLHTKRVWHCPLRKVIAAVGGGL